MNNNIKELRTNLSLSQKQFAKAFNTTAKAISNWEIGKTKPHHQQFINGLVNLLNTYANVDARQDIMNNAPIVRCDWCGGFNKVSLDRWYGDTCAIAGKDWSDLYTLYWRYHLSIPTIAQIKGTSNASVYLAMKELGIKRRTKIEGYVAACKGRIGKVFRKAVNKYRGMDSGH